MAGSFDWGAFAQSVGNGARDLFFGNSLMGRPWGQIPMQGAAGTSPTPYTPPEARKKLQTDLDSGAVPSVYADPAAPPQSKRITELPGWAATMPDAATRGWQPIPGWAPQPAAPAAPAPAPITPSNRISEAGEAMRTAGDELGKLMADYRKRLDDTYNAISAQKNPWDPGSDAFQRVLADSRNRVAAQMGGQQAANQRVLAQNGMAGGTRADAIRLNTELAGRRAQSQTEGALYADALRNTSAFEMQKQQALASLLGQGFNAGIQGTQMLSGLTEKAFTLPVGLDTAKAQGSTAQSQAAEAAAASRVNIEKANKEFDKIGLMDEAHRKALEAGILEGKVKIEEGKIRVEDATWWASLPGPLRTFLDGAARAGKTFVEGFAEGAGKAAFAGKGG